MDEDDLFDDDIDFTTLAALEEEARAKRAAPVASTSKLPSQTKQTTLDAHFSTQSSRTPLVQTTLDGASVTAKTTVLDLPVPKGKETKPTLKAVKVWDRAVWASRGWGSSKTAKKKSKGKRAARDDFSDEEDFEDDVDYGLDATIDDPDLDPARNAPTMKLILDQEAAKTYIYPIGKSVRSYQYNIVRTALFNNTLVSLPTGLGKTFIAAAVMYNFHRWYPEGKIIFMAPTRPLVTQQIEACYNIAPIAAQKCAEMTGHDAPAIREQAWHERRIFYCTPQTVQNDLKTGRIDASKIVLLIVDEAHKASGDYAYCGVVRYLMNKNPHFRVLALSATPGANTEAVQSVIDSLHIGSIESRTEASIDVYKYMYKKTIIQTIVPLTEDLKQIRDLWAGLMSENINWLIAQGIVHGGCKNPITTGAYAFQHALMGLRGKNQAYATVQVAITAKMSRAMDHLLTQSLNAFYSDLKMIMEEAEKKKGKWKNLVSSEAFVKVKRLAEQLRNAPDSLPHPKMDILQTMLKEHFQANPGEDSRSIVFCHAREGVEEIVDVLNRNKPDIRAARFVGQGADKNGKKGIAQKEQIATIQRFKDGDYNVLVATAVGEEGLDIGSVDVIFCYDIGKSSTKMLQRIGRTGRARDGKVVLLVNEDRESKNFNIAEEKYQDVQNSLNSSSMLEVYMDCERLNPNKDVTAIQEPLEAAPFERISLSTATARKSKQPNKAKDPKRNMPEEDVYTGFRKASEAAPAAPAKRKPKYLREAEERERKELPGLISLEKLATMKEEWDKHPPLDNIDLMITTDMSTTRRIKTGQIAPSRGRTALQAAIKLGNDIELRSNLYDKWEQDVWKDFQQSDVHWWHDDQKGTCSKTHLACIQLPRIITEPMDLSRAHLAADILEKRIAASQSARVEARKRHGKKVGAVESDDREEENAVVDLVGMGLINEENAVGFNSKKTAKAFPGFESNSEEEEAKEAKLPLPSRSFRKPTIPDSDDESDLALAHLSPRSPVEAVKVRTSPPKSIKKPAPLPIELSDTEDEMQFDLRSAKKSPLQAAIRASEPPSSACPLTVSKEAVFLVPTMQDSDEEGDAHHLTPLTAPSNTPQHSWQTRTAASNSVPIALARASTPDQLASDDDEFGFDDLDEFALMQIDEIDAQMQKKQSVDPDDSEIMRPPRTMPTKRKRIPDLDEGSSKSIRVLDGNRLWQSAKTASGDIQSVPAKALHDSSSPVIKPGAKKRKVLPVLRNTDKEDSVFNNRVRRREKTAPGLRKKSRIDQAKLNPFIDGEAECSGEENSSSADEAAENSSDREFVAADESLSPGDDMLKFYRESCFTQHPAAAAFHGSVKKANAFKLKYHAGAGNFSMTQKRHSSSEVSDYMDSSFCVGDDQIEYEEDPYGLDQAGIFN